MNHQLIYQQRHLAELVSRIDLTGKCVLEVGGCLPRELAFGMTGARRWIGIDLPEYWTESGDDNPSQQYEAPQLPIRSAKEATALDYVLLLGDVLDLPDDTGPFDAVFSSCAFEHIQGLEERLQTIRQVMRKGAIMLAVAMPIWSSPHGSHLLPLRDEQGNLWLPEALGLPNWHQLLWTAEEMMDFLETRGIPQAVISQTIYWVYRSPHLNRLFAGDYERIARTAGFSEHRILYPDRVEWANPETTAILEQLYPGKGPFDRPGVMLILRA